MITTLKHHSHLFAVVGALTLANINEIAGIAASVVAIVYTLWRWRRDAKRLR